MRFSTKTTSSFVLGSLLALPLAAQDAAKLDRGRYLAEEVGKCQECHSPRLENGQLDKDRWMKGAVLDFAPINASPNWHKTSPDITGSGNLWKKWGDEGMLNFMKTGLTPRNKPADPPMPAYKLSAADAEAIVAYLKSLK